MNTRLSTTIVRHKVNFVKLDIIQGARTTTR